MSTSASAAAHQPADVRNKMSGIKNNLKRTEVEWRQIRLCGCGRFTAARVGVGGSMLYGHPPTTPFIMKMLSVRCHPASPSKFNAPSRIFHTTRVGVFVASDRERVLDFESIFHRT